jgi:uncharacterized protein
LGLVLAIEGLLFAAFPEGMRRAMRQASDTPGALMRSVGFASAVAGVLLLWLIKAS